MEATSRDIERDSAFGGLFQHIINEMKNSSPLWEDLTSKSSKLHSCLRATIQAVSAFLDAFQKIADAATSTKGATKEIGTSLTRICMRHKALEAKLKLFTSSILDCLIIPLQEKVEEWKKITAHLDKEHAKEYKRSRHELKKRSIETLRLQKKLKKGHNNGGMSGSFSGMSGTLSRSGGNVTGIGHNMSSSGGGDSVSALGGVGGNRDLNKILEVALKDTADKRRSFEDAEKQAIRAALIEERSRFCHFVSFLKPVVDGEVSMLSELSHVQEAMQQLENQSTDPFGLPAASEQVITDLKCSCDSGTWSFTTPPSSPSSLGSRKSSMCSISSVNSSSSSSGHSPSHLVHSRTILHQPVSSHPASVGALRYTSVSSQDSGFMSQEPLYYSQRPTHLIHNRQAENQPQESNTSSTTSSNSSTPSSHYPPGSIPTTNATWPNIQDSIQFERAACAIMSERPHTISTAYEKGHQRPPLTVYTFQAPPESSATTPVVTPILGQGANAHQMQELIYQTTSEIYGTLRGKSEPRPPVPKRCSSLERPQQESAPGSMGPPLGPPNAKNSKVAAAEMQNESGSKNFPAFPDFTEASSDMIVPQPVYVNMHELNQMKSARLLRQQQSVERQELPPPPPELMNAVMKVNGVGSNSRGSHAPGGYESQTQIMIGDEASSAYGTTGSGSGSGSNSNSSTLTAKTSMGEAEVYGYLTGRQGRSSCGQPEKPLPPVRRSSSISSSSSPSRNSPASSPTQSQSKPLKSALHQKYPHHDYPVDETPQINVKDNIRQHEFGTTQGAADSLPPPPTHLMSLASEDKSQSSALLDDPAMRRRSVADTIKTLTEKNHQPVSPNMVRRAHSLNQPGAKGSPAGGSPPKPARNSTSSAKLTASAANAIKNSNNINNSNNAYRDEKERAHAAQALNHKLFHQQSPGPGQPAYESPGRNVQPSYVGRGHEQQQAYGMSYYEHGQFGQHHPNFVPVQSQPEPPQKYQQPIYQQIVHVKSSSQSETSSPTHSRRQSEEFFKATGTVVQTRVPDNRSAVPVVTPKDIFVQTLNAKLSKMRVASPERRQSNPPATTKTSFASKLVASVGNHHHRGSKEKSASEMSTAFRVRQWISSKTVPDPTLVRESLMDQIRRGKKLRQTRAVNDRSAPKIR